jgi:Flp pilus assembly protein TadD
MMRGILQIRVGSALLACAAALFVAGPAQATNSYSSTDESAASALGRYVRALTSDAKDFQSLIGAGRAALELGDTQAAAGFFARADEVNPRSPLPQLGMGAVSVANGDAAAAMPYFARAQQLGATAAMLGTDRGLAYDMLGQQALAQADYRAALNGPDPDEARRRMALSLAIAGDKNSALTAIAPLSARGDPSSPRVRAFVLALTGDTAAAMRAIDSAIPGSWASVAPFLQRLPSLAPGQKAAAVNLGIFQDGSAPAIYSAPPRAVASAPAGRQRPSTLAVSQSVNADRLAGIDALLRAPDAQPQPAYEAPQVQMSYAAPAPQQASLPAQQSAAAAPPKIWLQLATGSDPAFLSRKFAQLKSRNKDVFDGIPAYVAEGPQGARLVVGPFRGASDASIFADDLEALGVTAARWTNSAYDRIVPLATQ